MRGGLESDNRWHINNQMSWLRGSTRLLCFFPLKLVKSTKMSAISKTVICVAIGSVQNLCSLNAKVSLRMILNVHDFHSKGCQVVPSEVVSVATV